MLALPASLYDVDNNILARSYECLLAEKVRQNPVLYVRNPEQTSADPNKNRHQQQEIWLKISTQIHLELDSCISLWGCIRQRFIKHRKRLANGGDTIVKHWPLYDHLKSWLDKHIKRRRSQSDICHEIRSRRPLSIPPTVIASETSKPIPANSGQIPSTARPMPINQAMEFVDTIESAEWCEIQEETESQKPPKRPTTLKRKVNNSKTYLPAAFAKRSLKSDVISDAIDSADIFTELDENQQKPAPTPKPNQVKFVSATKDVVIVPAPKCVPTAIGKLLPGSVTIREVRKQPVEEPPIIPAVEPTPSAPPSSTIDSSSTFDGLAKLDKVIERCVQLVDKCIAQNSQKPDSIAIFGNFVSSMVRELPADKQMLARVEILQFTGDLITRLSNDNDTK